jgi:hypothetical protein
MKFLILQYSQSPVTLAYFLQRQYIPSASCRQIPSAWKVKIKLHALKEKRSKLYGFVYFDLKF